MEAILNTNVPDAPGLMDFASGLKQGMKSHPAQAAQIFTCMAAVRDASTRGYDAYCNMAMQLDVEPVSEEKYNEHDKAIFKPLVRASLKKNLQGLSDLPDEAFSGLDDLFDPALKEKSEYAFVRKTVEAILKLLGHTTNEQIADYSKLALAGLSLFRR